jgi:hypothetical protein
MVTEFTSCVTDLYPDIVGNKPILAQEAESELVTAIVKNAFNMVRERFSVEAERKSYLEIVHNTMMMMHESSETSTDLP